MYPTIQQGTSSTRPFASSQYPAFQQQQRPPVPNGDAASQNSTPSLRVHISEQFRTSPPVLISPDLLEPPKGASSAPADINLDLEKDLLANSESAARTKAPDTWGAKGERLLQLGFSREEITLAQAGCADNVDDESKVASFCEHLKELKAMGFSGLNAFGALTLHSGDMSAATDACLSAQ